MQELEYFRGQHRAAMNQLEVSAQEAAGLRGKYGDLLNDNQRYGFYTLTVTLGYNTLHLSNYTSENYRPAHAYNV